MAINTNISGIKVDSGADDNKIPVYDAASNSFLMETPSAGSGDVVGPASATDGVPALFDTTTGKLLKNSTPTGTGNPVMDTNPTIATRINVPEIKATTSAGVDIHNNTGTQVALFGAGGGTGSSLVGTTNVGSASADYHQIAGGTGTITNTATGSSTNININLVPKGAGVVQSNGKTLANLTDGGTFAADISVPDEAYGVGWNGSVEVPTKNAIYDKIETLTSPTALTLMPLPNHPISDATNGTTLSRQMNVNTTAWLGQIVVPFGITVNKITFRTGNNAVAGTVKIALYSEDGQTKKFEVTSATTSANAFITTSVSAVSITAGVYYVVIIPQSTCDVNIICWRQPATPSWLDSVASEPVIGGTITVTADTMPTTFTPSSITAAANDIAVIRLDN